MSINDPRSGPGGGPYNPLRDNAANWVFGVVVAVIMVGVGLWAMNQISPRTPVQVSAPSETR